MSITLPFFQERPELVVVTRLGAHVSNGDRKDGRHFDRALEVLWLAYLALATLNTDLPYATS